MVKKNSSQPSEPNRKVVPIVSGSVAYDIRSADSWDAVRHLEGHVELPDEPQLQKQQTKVVKARHNISLFAVASYVAVSALMILVIFSYVRLYEISSESVEYKNELARLQKSTASLAAEYDNTIDLSAIELIATTKLGMTQPNVSQVVYLDLSTPDRAEVYKPSSAADKLESIVQMFKNSVEYVRAYFE